MDVPRWLVELLACPVCRTPVAAAPDGEGLRCATCQRVYPVKDGVPNMLVSDARRETPEP